MRHRTSNPLTNGHLGIDLNSMTGLTSVPT